MRSWIHTHAECIVVFTFVTTPTAAAIALIDGVWGLTVFLTIWFSLAAAWTLGGFLIDACTTLLQCLTHPKEK